MIIEPGTLVFDHGQELCVHVALLVADLPDDINLGTQLTPWVLTLISRQSHSGFLSLV